MRKILHGILVFISPLTLGAQIEHTIYFDLNSFEVPDSSVQWIQNLSLHGAYNLKVEGYTDFLSDVSYNYRLAQQRNSAVIKSIEKHHPDAKFTIETEVQGEKYSREHPDSTLGIRLDRKVVLFIFKKETQLTDLAQAEAGTNIPLKGMQFQPGRHYLLDSLAYHTLDTLLRVLKANPNLRIRIEGHICCETKHPDGLDLDTKERKLSYNRAKYIYDYLLKQDIDSNRLNFEGKGFTEPIFFPEKSNAERSANRRVEIIVR